MKISAQDLINIGANYRGIRVKFNITQELISSRSFIDDPNQSISIRTISRIENGYQVDKKMLYRYHKVLKVLLNEKDTNYKMKFGYTDDIL